MRGTLFLLLFLTVVWLVVMVISPMTRRCRRRLEQYDAARGNEPHARTARAGPPTKVGSGLVSRLPDSQTAGYHVQQLLTRDGVLGAFFIIVLASFAIMNTRILAESFEVLLNRSGAALGTLVVAGLQLELTDLHVYGAAMSVALILLGGAYAASCEGRSSWRWFVLVAGVAPLVLFETCLAAQRGFILAIEGGAHSAVTPLRLAAYNAMQAYVCAVTETIGGYYAIHRALVPATLAIGWTAVAPWRWVTRGVMRLRESRRPRLAAPAPDPLRPGLATHFGAYVDEALVELLRDLDRTVARLLTRVSALLTRASESREVKHV